MADEKTFEHDLDSTPHSTIYSVHVLYCLLRMVTLYCVTEFDAFMAEGIAIFLQQCKIHEQCWLILLLDIISISHCHPL